MGTAIKHPVPDRVKPSFVFFDIWALWRSDKMHTCDNLEPITAHAVQLDAASTAFLQVLDDGHNGVWNSVLSQYWPHWRSV